MREDLEVGGLNVAVTIDKVCLVENDADFRKTADKHRTSEHAADDWIQMPKDRTAALSSHTTPEHTPGRLIFEELRVLLKSSLRACSSERQRCQDEKIFPDILDEQEHLQKIKNAEITNDMKNAEEMKQFRETLNQILDYEASLKGNKLNIMEKEDEVG
ncbi:hypothetical protein ABG067_006424 [Albugo candida]